MRAALTAQPAGSIPRLEMGGSCGGKQRLHEPSLSPVRRAALRFAA